VVAVVQLFELRPYCENAIPVDIVIAIVGRISSADITWYWARVEHALYFLCTCQFSLESLKPRKLVSQQLDE
jgi:hypothetical protein